MVFQPSAASLSKPSPRFRWVEVGRLVVPAIIGQAEASEKGHRLTWNCTPNKSISSPSTVTSEVLPDENLERGYLRMTCKLR